MTDTTATYTVTRTPLAAESYRTLIEVTATTNGLDVELFVFETQGDVFVSVATRYTLESAPADKQTAIDDGNPYYRAASVQRDYPSVQSAEAFVAATISRIEYLCKSIDLVAMPFTGTDTGTVPA